MSISTPTSTSDKPGAGKWYAGFVSAFVATYIVSRMENDYHINFEQFNMSAAVFKSFVEGSVVSFIVWATPSHIVDFCVDVIVFIKASWKRIKDAVTNPN